MLLGLYEEVSQAESRDAFLSGLVQFAHHLDFGRAGILYAAAHPSGYVFSSIANLPQGYEQSFHQLEQQVRDPVMQRLRSTNIPMFWDQQTYTAAEAADVWDVQAPFGYRTGVAVAIQTRQGDFVMFGVEREKHLPKRDAPKARLLADVQLMAVHAQAAAARLLGCSPRQALLTPRESEILGWVAMGKSTGVIAQLLGVTGNTVEFHLKNIYRKLGCNSRQTAVLEASRLGILRSMNI